MLTARFAAEAILSGKPDKYAIWDVKFDDDYLEEKRPELSASGATMPEGTTVPAFSTPVRP